MLTGIGYTSILVTPAYCGGHDSGNGMLGGVNVLV